MVISRMVWTLGFVLMAALLGTVLYWRVEILNRGGPVMIPIVMCSVFALAITIDRLIYFGRHGATPDRLFQELPALIRERRWKDAEDLCESADGPVAAVARAGLQARERPAEERESILADTAHEQLPLIERHHRSLSTIAQVSTLIGLLGTVLGMVVAFQVIQSKATSTSPVNPADLAGGIWQALVTTAGGLIVAIPTILAYNYLTSRSAEVQYQMEKVAAIVAGTRTAS